MQIIRIVNATTINAGPKETVQRLHVATESDRKKFMRPTLEQLQGEHFVCLDHKLGMSTEFSETSFEDIHADCKTTICLSSIFFTSLMKTQNFKDAIDPELEPYENISKPTLTTLDGKTAPMGEPGMKTSLEVQRQITEPMRNAETIEKAEVIENEDLREDDLPPNGIIVSLSTKMVEDRIREIGRYIDPLIEERRCLQRILETRNGLT